MTFADKRSEAELERIYSALNRYRDYLNCYLMIITDVKLVKNDVLSTPRNSYSWNQRRGVWSKLDLTQYLPLDDCFSTLVVGTLHVLDLGISKN